ncbi:plasmid replication protein, partial [Lactiplantibacillus plantarum]|nr:plasmid replication protein [Lactiplantibacillus plantarum]
HEWQADLMAYFNQTIYQENNWFTKTSLRRLSQELNICLGSLTKALNKLIDQGLVYREKGSGRQATKFATRSSLLQHAMRLQRQQRLNYWITVARLLEPSEELAALQQLSLDDRQDYHRNAQLSLLDTG